MTGLPTSWKTRDGSSVLIADMDDSHLDNTIAMLERNAERLHLREAVRRTLAFAEWEGGDASQDAADDWMMELAQTDPLAWVKEQPIYQALSDERRRRDGE